jgi:uncharacterized membrane protein YhfC
VWLIHTLAVWLIHTLAVWQCGSVAVWLIHTLAVWQCGSSVADPYVVVGAAPSHHAVCVLHTTVWQCGSATGGLHVDPVAVLLTP